MACTALALLLGLATQPAEAAPPELLSGLALHPTQAERMVLSYRGGGQGLLYSKDGGASFQMRCGAAISDAFTRSRAPLHLTQDGTTLLGTFQGLIRGGADGCSFDLEPSLSGLQVADFARHPEDPAVTFVATANSASGQPAGLVERDAQGRFRLLAASETPETSITRLKAVARPGKAPRLYASAIAPDDSGDYRPFIQYTDDLGETWIRREVEGANAARVLLLAVDPTDADALAVAVLHDGAPDRLLVSDDAGESFELRLELATLSAAAVAPDGRLWVGDSGGETDYGAPGGLYVLEGFFSEARRVATFRVHCLGYQGKDGSLFACTRNEFGLVDTETGEFISRSGLRDVKGFVECGEERLAAVCEPQLCNNWCGVLHYAEAPLCDAYDSVEPLCGPAAREYGRPVTSAENADGAGEPPPTEAPFSELATSPEPRASGHSPSGCALHSPRGASPRGPWQAGSILSLCALALLRSRKSRKARAALRAMQPRDLGRPPKEHAARIPHEPKGPRAEEASDRCLVRRNGLLGPDP